MLERKHYIGLMSGTSVDAVDAVLVDLSTDSPRVIASAGVPIGEELRRALLALNTTGHDEINRSSIAGNELSALYASAVSQVLASASLESNVVAAIGCHGQTIRHRPDRGYSIQTGNPALLAELVRIPVVTDFRSRDIAAGGQGAPLVPAFHARVFRDPSEDRVVLNLGGIANITYLPASGPVFGFDTGPGNCLLDHWAFRHLAEPFDRDGAWSRRGTVRADLLDLLLAEPYFSAARPKSTGRDLFSESWLESRLAASTATSVDVQATLVELTARSALAAARSSGPFEALIVCGGGTHNRALMQRLEFLSRPARVQTSAEYGVDPDYVEALAFAWLAQQAIEGRAGNLPAATGARGERVLGAIYPG